MASSTMGPPSPSSPDATTTPCASVTPPKSESSRLCPTKPEKLPSIIPRIFPTARYVPLLRPSKTARRNPLQSTIKMLGDREQVQSIEAGDTIELLRRVLPKPSMPEVLTAVRQKNARDREIAALFRNGEAARALSMKRDPGTAQLVAGDYDQVVQKIADLYIERSDALAAQDQALSVTITTLTNAEDGRHQPRHPRAPEGARANRGRRPAQCPRPNGGRRLEDALGQSDRTLAPRFRPGVHDRRGPGHEHEGRAHQRPTARNRGGE